VEIIARAFELAAQRPNRSNVPLSSAQGAAC